MKIAALAAVRCSAWLGRWWRNAGRRNMGSGSADQLSGTRNAGHNRIPGAVLAVWMRLESFRCALPEHAHALHESVGLWLRVLKLLVKLGYLSLKAQYFAARIRKLTCEKRDLLLQQVNHVFGQTMRRCDAGYLSADVLSTHGVERPNTKL